jgi:hypothetical protein
MEQASESQLSHIEADIDVFMAEKSPKKTGKIRKLTPYQLREKRKCRKSAVYFIMNYVKIYSANNDIGSGGTGTWIPFTLWVEQIQTLDMFIQFLLVIVLKARQLGLTWLALAYALWLMLFRPAATILIFSRRDDEAKYLLSDERLKGMYNALPEWLKDEVTKSDHHVWTLANGSTAKAFPTSGGDSYTATLAIVDEADLIDNLGKLLTSVKPTIDAGGKLFLISRVDKSKPQSLFKKMYVAAKQGLTSWKSIFLSWNVRPERTVEWYEQVKRDTLENTGTLDDLWEMYPANDAEALAARTADKRFLPTHLLNCYQTRKPLTDQELLLHGCPALPGFRVYVPVKVGNRYVVGCDPAEGNPSSNDTGVVVLDYFTGETCAVMQGKIEPSTTAVYVDRIGRYYNDAAALILRNNHGHAVLLKLKEIGTTEIINGPDGRPGYQENERTKTYMFDIAADSFRDMECMIYDFVTYSQLTSIEGNSLAAPEGELDDMASSCITALLARMLKAIRPTAQTNYLYDDDESYRLDEEQRVM